CKIFQPKETYVRSLFFLGILLEDTGAQWQGLDFGAGGLQVLNRFQWRSRLEHVKSDEGQTSSRWCGAEAWIGRYQRRCRPRHLTGVQNYEVRPKKPSNCFKTGR
ncbi:hypothetical protein AVEN_201551-1, partial [Araneus ventricosus]